MSASPIRRMFFIASQSVRTDISKKPDDFRDRKLTDLTTAQVTRAVLKSPAGEIELAKKNEHWEIVKPLQARGDDQKIGDLLAQVTNARIQEFVADDRGDLHAYGLSEPRGSITIYGADDKEGRTLQIGSACRENQGCGLCALSAAQCGLCPAEEDGGDPDCSP